MTNRTAATRYARALLDVALKEQADLSVIDEQLSSFADLFAGNEPLRRALLNPAVPLPKKRAAVAAILERVDVLPMVAKTLALLTDRDRLIILSDVAQAFKQRLMDLRNVVRADITTAQPIDADRLQSIQRSLADMWVSDPRFRGHYEQRAAGLAEYTRTAVLANADRADAGGD